MDKTLIVITGPTGVGKTATAIELAQQLHCDIINADSRQIYRGIPICTAAPTPEELAEVYESALPPTLRVLVTTENERI